MTETEEDKGKELTSQVLDLTTSTEGMSTKEFIAYMVDLSSEAKRVQLSLTFITDACKKCVDYAEKLTVSIAENEQLAKQNTDLIVLLDQEKEFNLSNRIREGNLKTKLKATEKDLKELDHVLKEKIDYLNLSQLALVDNQEENAKKNVEIDQLKIKVTELNRQVDQVRSSKYMCSRMFGSLKDPKDTTGLGYQEVPPPFNDNYTFLPIDNEMTKAVYGIKHVEPKKKVSEPKDEKECGGSNSSHDQIDECVEVRKSKDQDTVGKSNQETNVKKFYKLKGNDKYFLIVNFQ